MKYVNKDMYWTTRAIKQVINISNTLFHSGSLNSKNVPNTAFFYLRNGKFSCPHEKKTSSR